MEAGNGERSLLEDLWMEMAGPGREVKRNAVDLELGESAWHASRLGGKMNDCVKWVCKTCDLIFYLAEKLIHEESHKDHDIKQIEVTVRF